jgi:hypothetical protein
MGKVSTEEVARQDREHRKLQEAIASLHLYERAPDATLVDEYIHAALTGAAVKTLRRQRWTGDGLPFEKRGRSVRYRLGDIRAAVRTAPEGAERASPAAGLPTPALKKADSPAASAPAPARPENMQEKSDWLTKAEAIALGIEAEKLSGLSTLNGKYERDDIERLAGRG